MSQSERNFYNLSFDSLLWSWMKLNFEAYSQRESSTLSDNENDHHKFIKLLNSLIFIEINDFIWET